MNPPWEPKPAAKKYHALTVGALAEGGFVVSGGAVFCFACTTLDEALAFVKKQLEPEQETK